MRKLAAALLPLIFLIACTSTTPEIAEETGKAFGRDPAFEQEVYDKLSEVNPDAVPVFIAATEAMDSEHLDAARVGYEQVLELVPDSPDAYRRLSYVEASLGNIETAIGYAETALELDDVPVNRAAVARALIWRVNATPADKQKAYNLAKPAFNEMPDDESIALTLVLVCASKEDLPAARQAIETLIRAAPTEYIGHYFAGWLAVEDRRWILADEELALAMQYGLPQEMVDEEAFAAVHRQANLIRTLRTGGWVLVGWVVGLGLLFATGIILSSMTLAAIKRAKAGEWNQINPGERRIRSIYRFFISMASIYFYASIPLLIVIVVVGAAAIIYLFFLIGRIPIRILLFLGPATLYTLFAILRSIFTQVKQKPPGKPLAREQAPRLWALLEEIAAELGTSPVNAVYVTSGTNIGVSEYGSVTANLRGAGERRLILGLGALPGMTMNEFKAILAHEYGHFSHRDTAGGELALRVRASIHNMAMNLRKKGQDHLGNPVFLFLVGYNRIFMRISLGASRLQEILADRYAALAYGSRNLIDGLNHIVRQNLTFTMQVNNEINSALQQQRNPANLYTLPELDDPEVTDSLEQQIRKEISRPTSAFDSHPSIKDRIELLEGILTQASGGWDDREVWDLIPQAEQLQQEMTVSIMEQARVAVGLQPNK